MLKRSIILAVTLLGITSFTQVAGAAAPTDSGLLSDIPYLGTFYRYGQPLIKRVLTDVFGDGSAFRSTKVYIYNHSSTRLYFLSSSFYTGGFSTGSYIPVIEPGSVHNYSVESHGVGTGVTDADLRFGTAPGASTYCVRIVTSNATLGDVKAWGEAYCGLMFSPQPQPTVGNNNEVYVDIW